MGKLIDILLIVLLLIFAVMNCVLVSKLQQKTTELIELTNLEPEIIFLSDTLLTFDTVYIQRYDTIRLIKCQVDTITLNDTTIIIDSVDVVLPIELKHYSDTLANTAISLEIKGFNCEIDNLYIKNFLSVPTQQKVPKQWYNNIHLGVGLGATYLNEFKVVPSVGIYYTLFSL